MTKILFKTKSGTNLKGKPRVYFTCHPDDFERTFEKICNDIFKTHDCVIYYKENMGEIVADEDKATDLGQMNLFVIPVTFKLLTKANAAMDDDFLYAKQENIAVLPIMMESGIDEFYSKPDKFGERQYLNPYSTDMTEIRYEEKLEKYLQSVLISDEMAQRVRKAFDAYIFLSYRKKDRRYANELMKMIHRNPECRDIAIWYDEFLTPGESFNENINKILADSKLFALLVTPNLLEEPNGQPNFVMANEYPAAHKKGMDILPAEMEDTDKGALNEKFKGLPECVNAGDDEEFRKRLVQAISKVAISANNNDPEHNFLIGLAYLDGIDVEVNKERGVELITLAAEAELPEAMKKLFDMYENGSSVQLDYYKAAKWAERLAECYKKIYGDEDKRTLWCLHRLAMIYRNLRFYKKSVGLLEKIYEIKYKLCGENSSDTMISLNNLALLYVDIGDYKNALELQERAYKIQRHILGEDHIETLVALGNLACTYFDLGEDKKSKEILENVYARNLKILGEEHINTLNTLNNLGGLYCRLGMGEKAIETMKYVYELRCKLSGVNHTDTLFVLYNLAMVYENFQKYDESVGILEEVCKNRCEILGMEHPDTLQSLIILSALYEKIGNYSKRVEIMTTINNLAFTYYEIGEYKKESELEKRIYTLMCDILGEEHKDTLKVLNDLTYTYYRLGDYEKECECEEKLYLARRKIFGEECKKTLTILSDLAYTYRKLNNYRKAAEHFELLYKARVRSLGEKDEDTLAALNQWAYSCADINEHNKAIELYSNLYDYYYTNSHEYESLAMTALHNIGYSYNALEEYEKSVEFYEKAYIAKCKTLGQDDKSTLKTLSRLEEARKKILSE